MVLKNKIDFKSNLMKGPQTNVHKPKNSPRKIGNKIIVKGISGLKVASNCNEFEIQYVPVKKNQYQINIQQEKNFLNKVFSCKCFLIVYLLNLELKITTEI